MPFAFDEESEKQFRWLLTRYPQPRAALLPAFRLAEAQHGRIDGEVEEYLAVRLALPPSAIHAAASFYTHYRRPGDGKYVVMVCRTLPCALRGAAQIVAAFEEHLGIRPGQTTGDGLFTLRTVECLGTCANAPAAQINDDYFEDLTIEKVRDIVLALRHGQRAPHVSAGPSLAGGCRQYVPLVEATGPTEQEVPR